MGKNPVSTLGLCTPLSHTYMHVCAHNVSIMCLERVFHVADILVDCLLEVALPLYWEFLRV